MAHGVSVVIPALNEEESIGAVVREMPWNLIRECIVVDNGSTDATASEATAAGARVVTALARGYGRACAAGAAAADEGSDILVFMDGDGSDVPAEMGQLLQPLLNGDCDFVIGSRMRGKREPGSMQASQIFAGWLAGRLLKLLYRVSYTDMGPFRAIKREALTRLQHARTNLRLESGDANASSAMRPAHPRNPSKLPQTGRRCKQGSRLTKRLVPSRHTHHPNPGTSSLNPKTLNSGEKAWDTTNPHQSSSKDATNPKGIGRVPHVRTSVRGTKTKGDPEFLPRGATNFRVCGFR